MMSNMKMQSKLLMCFVMVVSLFFTGLSFAANTPPQTETAIFAGGCFWCMQEDFDQVKGVVHTTAGYTGGTQKNPTYEEVSAGITGDYESVKVEYDPSVISYPQLLQVFWHDIDPTDPNGQFCDKGAQYRAVIFYSKPQQQQAASLSKQQLIASGRFKEIVTQILPATPFYPAETYHQEYYKKNPLHYKFYRYTCGRDQRLKQVWGTSS